jgi:hypothetical protein
MRTVLQVSQIALLLKWPYASGLVSSGIYIHIYYLACIRTESLGGREEGSGWPATEQLVVFSSFVL